MAGLGALGFSVGLSKTTAIYMSNNKNKFKVLGLLAQHP